QRRGSAGAGAEVAKLQASRLVVLSQPAARGDAPSRQLVDVESQLGRLFVDQLFARRQQVEQERSQPRFIEDVCDEAIAWAQAAAAAAVCEQDQRMSAGGQCQMSFDFTGCQRDRDLLALCRPRYSIHLALLGHGVDSSRLSAGCTGSRMVRPASSSRARCSSSSTSASLVWVKSSYHRPTDKKGSGVAAHTTSSTSARNSSHVSGSAMGTATTILAGPSCRSASVAARIDDPVANPSSTRMSVLPVSDGGGRPC